MGGTTRQEGSTRQEAERWAKTPVNHVTIHVLAFFPFTRSIHVHFAQIFIWRRFGRSFHSRFLFTFSTVLTFTRLFMVAALEQKSGVSLHSHEEKARASLCTVRIPGMW